MVAETDVGIAHVSLLHTTTDPVIGLANRAITLHVKVHDLQGRIAKLEHTVVHSLKPDATLMTKEVEVLEGKVNGLKTSVQGANASLLEVGSSSEEGLKAQVVDLETRVAELMSTTTSLETEVHGLSNQGVTGEALLQKENTHAEQGLAPRMSVLKVKVSKLKSRVFALEHVVLNGLRPDAALLEKDVEILEGKVKSLKVSVQGPAASLLGVASSEVGLKSQVADLEIRVAELLSTTATLETELHGPSNQAVSGQALLQKEQGDHELVFRVSVLKDKVSNLKSRVFILEHHVADLGLFEKDAASLKQNHFVASDHRDVDDNERKSLTTSLDLDVKIMEGEFSRMNEKMRLVENTLGVAAAASGATTEETTEETTEGTALQQTDVEPTDPIRDRINLLETNVADLLSRTIAAETDVGIAHVSLLHTTTDPVIGLANRAITLHVKVHDLQGRIAKLEHTVVHSLKPDATLMTKEVEVLEGKVNGLKTSVQGANASLLEVGSSSEEGLKSQEVDLETRVAELMSTTTSLETEVHGLSNQGVIEEALLQEESMHEEQGLAPRMSVLKVKVSKLKSRVFALEHHVNGLVTGLYVEK